MKSVILINEENHGLIGVAKNYETAIEYLFNSHWIDKDTEIFTPKDETKSICETNWEWKKVFNVFGENWKNKIRKMDISDFNYFFEGTFFLSEEKLIGTK